MNAKDEFGFVAFDDVKENGDEFGFVSFQPKSKDISSEPYSQEQEKSEEQSIFSKSLKDIFTGLPGQIALGLTQAVTSPLDLMKLWMTGEALTGLDEAEEASLKEGIPFDREKEQSKILNTIETSVPTLSMAEKWLNEQNISTNPQNTLESISRGIAEFGGGLAPKNLKTPKLKPKSLGPEEQLLRQTADKYNLRKFAGMESENPPTITPIVSAEKEAKLASELGDSSKKAIDEIIDQKIPVKKMRDAGVNLEEAYDVAYGSARKTAAEMGKTHIDYSNVLEWINKEIKRVKASSPSLSNSQKAYINVLKKEKSSLTKKIPAKNEAILYGPNGEVLTKPSKAKIVQKNMNADQALNQIRNNNDNVKGIWRKPEFAGSENAIKNAYAGLNEQFINAIEKANPKLGKEITFANKIFHEGSKLEQVEGILKKSFSDGYNPKKLAKNLSSKRDRKFLERSLGKDGVQDLERIAKYGQKAQEKVFNQLKNPKTFKEYLTTMTPMQLGLLLAGKSHVGALYYLPKAIAERTMGLIFTRNSTKKNYIQFLQDVSKFGKVPSSQVMIRSSRNLQKSIEEEFGSEEELLQMATQED